MTQYNGIEIDYSRDDLLEEFGLTLLKEKYLKNNEKSPQEAYARTAVAFCGGDLELAQRIYDYVSKRYVGFASPVLSNSTYAGEPIKSLPISCFASMAPDNLQGLIDHSSEIRWLTVMGGGTAGHWSSIRAVSDKAPGPIPFIKTLDADIDAYAQGKCYHPDVEVLTSEGFMSFEKAMKLNLPLYQVSADNSVSITREAEYVKLPFKGNLIRFHDSKNIDISVTPNHRMYYKTYDRLPKKLTGKLGVKGISQNFSVRQAKDLKLNRSVVMQNSVKHKGSFILTDMERLLIAFQADGSTVKLVNGDKARFHFSKQRKIDRLRTLLNSLELGYKESKQNDGTSSFYVYSDLGPKTFCDMPFDNLQGYKGREFLLELSNWDGTNLRTDSKGRYSLSYCTTIKSNADFVQRVASLSGFKSRLTVAEAKDNKSEKYVVYLSEGESFGCEHVNKTEVEYDGFVYCAVVPYGGLIVRSNGHTLVCGNTRRGSYAAYLDVSHPDIMEFIKLRVPTGDASRKCNSVGFHNAVNISDAFMDAVKNNLDWPLIDPHSKEVRDIVKARDLWQEILLTRHRTGEPYLTFIDTANRALPDFQKKKGLFISGSNLCNEIYLPTNEERSFVCCLSSLNAEMYREWKDTNIVEDLITFLDNVIQVFIDNCPPQLSKSKYSATMERALGLGIMGLHSLYQKEFIPFESKEAFALNRELFALIKTRALTQTFVLGKERGEPEDCKGTGRRNSHLLAVAPTANNAIIIGTDPSIEPQPANVFLQKTRIGSFVVKNKFLKEHLAKLGLDTEEIWKSITINDGSVQHLDIPDDIKAVFKTAIETDQMAIVEQAGERQKYICQGQSLNLFFKAETTKKYFREVHERAFEVGCKGLYYVRAKTKNSVKAASVTKVREQINVEADECEACQ